MSDFTIVEKSFIKEPFRLILEIKKILVETAAKLRGSDLLIFMAKIVNSMEKGDQRKAESELGWTRKFIRKGQGELINGPLKDNFSARGCKAAIMICCLSILFVGFDINHSLYQGVSCAHAAPQLSGASYNQNEHKPVFIPPPEEWYAYTWNGELRHSVSVRDWDGISDDGLSHAVRVIYPDGTLKHIDFDYKDSDTQARFYLIDDSENVQSGDYTYQVTDFTGNPHSEYIDTLDVEFVESVDRSSVQVQAVGYGTEFTWQSVSSNVMYYHLMVWDSDGDTEWQGYTKECTYVVPSGTFDPFTSYKYQIRTMVDHRSMDIDNTASTSSEWFYTGAENQTPYISVGTGKGIRTWGCQKSGTALSPYVKVYDAQGVPNNIHHVKVIFPDQKTEIPLFFDEQDGRNSGYYKTYFFGEFPEGIYTFQAEDNNGNRYEVSEELIFSQMPFFDESAVVPKHNTLFDNPVSAADQAVQFSWNRLDGAKLYSLKIYNQNDERLYSFNFQADAATTSLGAETRSVTLLPEILPDGQPDNLSAMPASLFTVSLPSDLFKHGITYNFYLSAMDDFYENDYLNKVDFTLSSQNPEFKLRRPLPGTSPPEIDLDNYGVYQLHSLKVDKSGAYFGLHFKVRVSDPDGIDSNIKKVYAQYPDGTEIPLYLKSLTSDTEGIYYNWKICESIADIPEGNYVFTVEDYDGNISRVQDELTVFPLPVPENISPAEGSETSVNPYFSWDTVEGASYYRIKLFDELCGWLLSSEYLTEPGYRVPDDQTLCYDTFYQYRIYAYREHPETEELDNSSENYYYCFVLPWFKTAAAPDIQPDNSLNTIVFEKMIPTLKQPWYFDNPRAIAADTEGHIYVTDTDNRRIQKLTSDGSFITVWGSEGDRDGEFQQPFGIAVDEDGNVYVGDHHNNRIQKFTSDGTFITAWGSYGDGDGEFKDLWGVAVDGNGNVYVADTRNDRIQKFTSEGVFITKWGNEGSDTGEFRSPEGIAVDSDGNVYVADYNNRRIQKFTSDGAYITTWGSKGKGEGEFERPRDVTVDKNGNVYVVESGNHRIQKFTSDGEFIRMWGSKGKEPGELSTPTAITVDGNGDVYTVDLGSDRIQKFTTDGTFISIWGSESNDDGRFDYPSDIAVEAGGNFFVSDKANNRIQKFARDGSLISTWGSPGEGELQFQSPFSIAVDQNGNIFVSEWGNHRIQKFSSYGTFITMWGEKGEDQGEFDHPFGIAVDQEGNLYVSDQWNHRIQKFTSDGVFILAWGEKGYQKAQFDNPRAIAIDNSGMVYVADTTNHRIQKFTSAGKFILMWGSYGTEQGQFKNPRGITVDSNGNVYVSDAENCNVQKFTSDGKFLEMWGTFGSSPGQMKYPKGIEIDNSGKIMVCDAKNDRIQIFKTKETQSISKAIIVAGGGNYQGNVLWDATQLCANFAYRSMLFQGYTKDSIYYLSSDTDLDLDNNQIADDVDADATNENMHKAITEWAADAEELLLYITDHGGDGTFRMGDAELLSAQELKIWLDQMQGTTGARVLIIYDACQSGSFLPVLSDTTYDRIFISSASHDEQAYFTAQGQLSFSYLFWGNIFNGMSLYDAFLNVKNAVAYTYNQTPQVNSDGNASGNEDSDMEGIKGMIIGNGIMSADDIPFIGSISPDTTLTGETTYTIYAQDVTDANGISEVWAVITPPDNSNFDPSDPVLYLPEVQMSLTGENIYKGQYSGFTHKGTYNIAVYAKDTKGNLSIPKQTTFIQTSGEPPDSNQTTQTTVSTDLSIDIPCLKFQENFYRVQLTPYNHPADSSNLYWKLDSASAADCTGVDTADTESVLENNLDITIGELQFQGIHYTVYLIYYQNPDDPFNLPHWVLGEVEILSR